MIHVILYTIKKELVYLKKMFLQKQITVKETHTPEKQAKLYCIVFLIAGLHIFGKRVREGAELHG